MLIKTTINAWLIEFKEAIYTRLSSPNSLIHISILGLISGLLSSACIVAFRLVIEGSQGQIISHDNLDDYESLSSLTQFLLPTLSGLAIALLFYFIGDKGRDFTGIINVMERVAYHQSKLKLKGLFLQFVGGALAVAGGHSVGREGPGIHLGAAATSVLGQYLGVPNNVLRTLVGCGSAAAIAASFNTPLAGVIFAMEVIMLEYSLSSVIPIILASVSGTALTILVFGDAPVFTIPEFAISSIKDVPVLILLGVLAGIISTSFINLILFFGKHSKRIPFILKVTSAGMLVGLIAMVTPQVLSIGYDSVNSAILGNIGLGLIIGILFMKVLATSISIGLGIPGGMIAPTMFMGAMLGASLGMIQEILIPSAGTEIGLLAVVGMGAMMGATLQAPLAALIALLELTNNPGIIFPGMLVIVIAELTRSEIFNQPSAFQALLQTRGLTYDRNPLTQHLRKIGVFGVMSKSFTTLDPVVNRQSINEAIQQTPRWILIKLETNEFELMPGVDLARHLEENPNEEETDLRNIRASRHSIKAIYRAATLQEAADSIKKEQVKALYVFDRPSPSITRIRGILHINDIEQAYHY